jgi:U4/U6.U5 tri-snRNP-associated protein 1
MVLTLKDSRIIGEDGDVDGGDDTLENVRLSELRGRERARAAAKRKPEGAGAALLAAEEEGPRRLLAKYDDVAGPEAMALDAEGAVDAAKRAREAEVRRRLAAVSAGVGGAAAADSAATAAGTQADFFSADEMAAFAAPKKLRKKKKLRPRPLTADELLPLEEDDETARAAGADHGSRARGGGGGAAAGGSAAAADAGWSRFEAAKAKATAATARLIGTRAAPVGDGGDDVADGEEDAALAAALERSRRAAAASGAGGRGGASAASIAQRIAAERAANTGAAASAAAASGSGGAGGVMFTDTQEFVRTISVERARARAEEAELTGIVGATVLPPAPDAGADEDDEDAKAMPPPKARRAYRDRHEAVEAEEEGGRETTAGGGGDFPPLQPRAPGGNRSGAAELASAAQGTGSAARGLAATLALLKDKGALSEGVTWAGRTTDKKKDRIAVAVEADAIGTSDPNYNFNFKLDRFDEFGRKMTPKEAFRELCHKFHGIFPSRGKQEARLRQWHEEQARLKASTGDTALESAEKMRAAQLRTATPFVVLSGSIKSAQVTDASSRYATAERAEASLAAPARAAPEEDAGGYGAVRPAGPVGGGAPLEGAEKVRFMLGMPGAGAGKRGAPGAAGNHAAKRPRTDQ